MKLRIYLAMAAGLALTACNGKMKAREGQHNFAHPPAATQEKLATQEAQAVVESFLSAAGQRHEMSHKIEGANVRVAIGSPDDEKSDTYIRVDLLLGDSDEVLGFVGLPGGDLSFIRTRDNQADSSYLVKSVCASEDCASVLVSITEKTGVDLESRDRAGRALILVDPIAGTRIAKLDAEKAAIEWIALDSVQQAQEKRAAASASVPAPAVEI